ncbi:hypothetical protein, partial [Nitrosomonas sp. Nm51]|uniref:hypothetical protein n=1 Tax=Nitrosomonas sp. Nm51 TaxID=133720 RepID=UPI001C435A5E
LRANCSNSFLFIVYPFKNLMIDIYTVSGTVSRAAADSMFPATPDPAISSNQVMMRMRGSMK